MAFASSGTEPAQRCREIKIVLLGDSGVGKSSIAQRYVTDTFRPHGESTIGASFMSKMIVNNGSPCKCQIWDTAGQEKYHSLAPMYYRGAAAAILVYDMTKRASFEKLKAWVGELRAQGPEAIALCIAGNKADLAHKRAVDADAARAYADECGALFLETSAKDDTNVSALFTDLVKNVKRDARPPAGANALRIDAAPGRKGCCA